MGGVLKALHHPVIKVPAISLPCHWPSHSQAPGASAPATQGVRVCLAMPPLPDCWVWGGGCTREMN